MTDNRSQQRREIGFNSVKVLSDVPLGTGSYGSVYKAQCDDVVCAAKLLHPTLVAEIVYERSPQKRFAEEIEFLGHLRHPNIVQFLGVTTDSNTKLPILLMELMDESLTLFLKRFEGSLPLYTQLDICHSVAMALSYLHANGIAHRDLSSNNVLMLGNRCIKVSDFGMARFRNQHTSNTVCPGTEVYMPPEAVLDNPTYTEKIDCFSFGVLAIQIITKKFPSPGPRNKKVNVNGRALLEPQSEYNRREDDILKIPSNHVLRDVACDCLKENEGDRPSASELCTIVARLKENCGKQHTSEELAKDLVEKERELAELRMELQRKANEINTLREQVQALTRHHELSIENRQRQLHEDIPLFEPERMKNISANSLSEMLQRTHLNSESYSKEGPEAPCPMSRSCDAIVCGCFMYVMYQQTRSHLFVYNNLAESWSQLPDCLTSYCSLAVIKDSLVTVGGLQQVDGEKTNKLYTLSTSSGRYFWSMTYPPMPTKRRSVIVAAREPYLVVIGGVHDTFSKQVEILHTDTRTWSIASSLPTSIHSGSATISGNRVFVIGGWVSHTTQSYAAMSCILDTLINSGFEEEDVGTQNTVWNCLASLPVTQATCVSCQSHVLAVGGQDKEGKPTKAVLAYNDASNSWIKLTDLKHARSECLAAVLPNELVVLGGYTDKNFTNITNSVEIIVNLVM